MALAGSHRESDVGLADFDGTPSLGLSQKLKSTCPLKWIRSELYDLPRDRCASALRHHRRPAPKYGGPVSLRSPVLSGPVHNYSPFVT
jgi:hypothetical protein